ncbi:hypothetical protein BH10BDE1_BH10BDE1_13510 [soil metagenome]
MTNSNLATNVAPNSKDLESKFKLKLESFSDFAVQYGLKIAPYSEITWPKFRSLNGLLQLQAYESFKAYYDLCLEASASGIPLNDDRTVAWWAVQKFGLRPCSDFFDKLQPGDVLELYDTGFVQLYRNWAFFQISSYSMADLFVYPWPDLYVRDEEVMKSLMAYSSMVLSGEHRATITCSAPRHIVIESLSADKNVLDMQVKYTSPLFDSEGNIAAFFVTSSVYKIGTKEQEERVANTEKPEASVAILTLA